MRTNQEHKSSAMIEFGSPAANRDILAPRHPCNRLRWLGVTMDPSANDQAKQRIGAKNSEVDILIIPTGEETTIARHCSAKLSES
jgi:acetate kinase